MKKRLARGLAAVLLLFPFAACAEANAETLPKAADTLPEFTEEIAPPEETVFPEEIMPPEETTSPEEIIPPEETKNQKIRYICVKIDGLNIRAGAGIDCSVVGQTQKNILFGDEGEENGWLRTRYRGKTAYLSKNEQYVAFFSMEAGSETVEKIIAEGVELLGTPYVYGAVRLHDGKGNMLKGFTRDVFDCSSLMQYIFYRGAGIQLDVTTRTQVLQGTAVPRGELRRGDLLFFTNASRRNKTGIERIGHVALYLGENYILHTASDFAKIEQISPARWDNFITARRMV